MTAAPRGSLRAQSRTAFAPMAVEGARPRPARNSTATPSYPLDRSVIDRTLSVAKGLTDCASAAASAAPESAKDTVLFVKRDLVPHMQCQPSPACGAGVTHSTAPVKTKTSARIPSLV